MCRRSNGLERGVGLLWGTWTTLWSSASFKIEKGKCPVPHRSVLGFVSTQVHAPARQLLVLLHMGIPVLLYYFPCHSAVLALCSCVRLGCMHMEQCFNCRLMLLGRLN